jgi:alkylation response protein AidB-like acyl-CoA dehydrogenase
MAPRRASQRRQFGRALREHQEIAFAIADRAASLHAARLVANEAAWRYDNDPEDRQLSGAFSKLIGADMVGHVADQTLQIFGGRLLEGLSRRARLARGPRREDSRRHVGDDATDRGAARARPRRS